MRPSRIISFFGALGVGVLAVMLLASWAVGGESPRVFYQSSEGSGGGAVAIARGVPGVQAVRSNVRIDVDDDATAWESSSPRPFEKPQHHPFFGPSPRGRDN